MEEKTEKQNDFAAQVLAQSVAALRLLASWSLAHGEGFEEARRSGKLPDLKEFVNYLTALKRVVEIIRMVRAFKDGKEGGGPMCEEDREFIQELFAAKE